MKPRRKPSRFASDREPRQRPDFRSRPTDARTEEGPMPGNRSITNPMTGHALTRGRDPMPAALALIALGAPFAAAAPAAAQGGGADEPENGPTEAVGDPASTHPPTDANPAGGGGGEASQA